MSEREKATRALKTAISTSETTGSSSVVLDRAAANTALTLLREHGRESDFPEEQPGARLCRGGCGRPAEPSLCESCRREEEEDHVAMLDQEREPQWTTEKPIEPESKRPRGGWNAHPESEET